jgi:membrane-bound lytic murein transglycosylase B
MKIKLLSTFICSLLFSSIVSANYAERPEVQVFIEEMSTEHDFDPAYLRSLFAQAERQDKVIDLMQRPSEAKPWHEYRALLINGQRVNGGVEFWEKHKTKLQEAQKRYGVPPQMIVAIIGVETSYGGNTGSFRVFDTLTTLAFDYPRRAEFFRSELKEYLILTRDEKLEVMEIKGSYAGAMGPPQFMPSSYRAYAVDYDGGEQIDLLNNMDDAIISVANYFSRHGWKRDGLVAVPAVVTGEKYKELLSNEYRTGMSVLKPQKPELPASKLADYGITTKPSIPGDQKVTLLELKTSTGYEYWVGLNNFYVITRYNHSVIYAMAVYQLSQLIEEAYRG